MACGEKWVTKGLAVGDWKKLTEWHSGPHLMLKPRGPSTWSTYSTCLRAHRTHYQTSRRDGVPLQSSIPQEGSDCSTTPPSLMAFAREGQLWFPSRTLGQFYQWKLNLAHVLATAGT